MDIQIVIDIATGLLCSFVWWFLFVLIGGKKKIDYLVTIAIDCARQFEHAISFCDYDNACGQADRLIDFIFNIEESIKLLTYLPKKKKLIRTYLYSVFYVLTVFKNITVGYDGDQEREAKCQRFERKYLSKLEFDENSSVPFISFTLEILQKINRTIFVKKALLSDVGVSGYGYCSLEKKRELLSEKLVYINVFKNTFFQDKGFIHDSIFTCIAYKKYIFKKMKS